MPVPWTPAEATRHIRRIAANRDMTLYWTGHARERLLERNLIMGDVLHVLKRGFVHEEAVPSTRPGLFKYAMDSPTPNSGARMVRVVVVPDETTCEVKIITVMWKDEQRN